MSCCIWFPVCTRLGAGKGPAPSTLPALLRLLPFGVRSRLPSQPLFPFLSLLLLFLTSSSNFFCFFLRLGLSKGL